MPRPSKKDERTAEILDAYGRCIARHGVDGTTLEMTAEEAGLARALIRHNVGNKDDILDAFVNRFLEQASRDTATLFDALPEKPRIDTLIDWLFDQRYSNASSVRVSNALFAAATDRPALARELSAWTSAFSNRIGDELRRASPTTDESRIAAAATGIVAIYFNYDSMSQLGRAGPLRKNSTVAARMLVEGLG